MYVCVHATHLCVVPDGDVDMVRAGLEQKRETLVGELPVVCWGKWGELAKCVCMCVAIIVWCVCVRVSVCACVSVCVCCHRLVCVVMDRHRPISHNDIHK